MFYLPAGDPYGKYVYLSEVLSTVRGRKLTEFIKFLLSFSQRRQISFFYVVLLLIKSNWQINSKRFGNCKHTQSRKRIFKSSKFNCARFRNRKIALATGAKKSHSNVHLLTLWFLFPFKMFASLAVLMQRLFWQLVRVSVVVAVVEKWLLLSG